MLELMVIIPYFQRESGILNKTLQSIDSQTAFDTIIGVVIVDDGSPIPAKEEMSDITTDLLNKIHIIKQGNQGVSRARNVGLEYAHLKGEYIAFLDSDDIWLDTHVAQMVRAFELGAQFYFANFYQPEQTIGAFERGQKLKLEEHRLLERDLYSYDKDMIEQIMTGNLIGTSTVGFKNDDFSGPRFVETLHFAGEDYLFWLELATQNPKIIFNNKVAVRNGKGVNIFASAKWGTMHLQTRLTDELSFRKMVLAQYTLSNTARKVVLSKVWQNRKQLILNGMSLLKSGDWKILGMLIIAVFKDPKILLSPFSR